jgi:creatinine amidohydrolase/Fe(II)-dependent formamide hydrolase-like protein
MMSARSEEMVDLKVKESELSACGPYPALRARALVFTVGNDFEWHGPALPADIDSRTIKAMALRFCGRAGATFAAHVPYTSDWVGEAALDWSPAYIPFDEFKHKLIAYVKAVVGSWPVKPVRVIILMGHGGLIPLLTQAGDVEDAVGVETRVVFPAGLSLKDLELPEGFEGNDALREILGGKGEHAYIMEHSVAAHFGFMDRDKLDEINELAAEDPEAALRRWPALAGLGGYIKFGDKRYDPLRKIGLEFCADDFIKRRKLPVSAKAGAVLVEAALLELEKIALENM